MSRLGCDKLIEYVVSGEGQAGKLVVWTLDLVGSGQVWTWSTWGKGREHMCIVSGCVQGS